MLSRLEMSLTWVIGLIVIGRIVNILFLRVWGSLSDYISNKSVLAVCSPLFLVCILGWTFTTFPDKHVLTLPLLIVLHVIMGVAMAGITLALGNIGLKLAPKDQGISYLASMNFVSAIAAGLAPIISGRLVDFFVERQLSWTIAYTSPRGVSSIELVNFQQWDFLFFVSLVVGLYGVHRLSLVVERGEVEERVVLVELVSALGREVRDFSTVAAIRNVLNIIPARIDPAKRERGRRPMATDVVDDRAQPKGGGFDTSGRSDGSDEAWP
jgi:MFS family permease